MPAMSLDQIPTRTRGGQTHFTDEELAEAVAALKAGDAYAVEGTEEKKVTNRAYTGFRPALARELGVPEGEIATKGWSADGKFYRALLLRQKPASSSNGKQAAKS